MQVILKEHVKHLGHLGDIVNVKPGYARNFLVPYGKAAQATKKNIAIFEKQKRDLEKAEEKRLTEAKSQAEKILENTLVIKVRAGEGGKLFGSVGSKEIADTLRSDLKINVEKRRIKIPDGAIRCVGKFKVLVSLHSEINAEISLSIESE